MFDGETLAMKRSQPIHSGTARALALMVLLMLPTATAADGDDRATIFDGGPVHLEGDVTAHLAAASGEMNASRATSVFTFHGLNAQILVVKDQNIPARVLGQGANLQTALRQHEWINVTNGSLAYSLEDESGIFALDARSGGDVRIHGAVDTEERPTMIRTATSSHAIPNENSVVWHWDAGDFLIAREAPILDIAGFPAFDGAATLDVEGSLSMAFYKGNATVTDDDGIAHEFRLGRASAGGLNPDGSIDNVTWLRFSGTVERGGGPLSGAWGFAGPAATWTVNGTATWASARGDGTVQGARVEFRNESVSVAGVFDITPAMTGSLTDLDPALRYAAEGTFTSFTVSGAPVPTASRISPAEVVVTVSLVAIVLTALGAVARFALLLYTRLSPTDILAQETRKRIHDAIVASGGIHKRDLHRRIGCAWGPLTYHVRVLADAGYIRVERQGKYTVISPLSPVVTDQVVTIPHPVARAIYERLPTGGIPMSFADLHGSLGISRQLLGYHLRGLEAKGLVRVARVSGRSQAVTRIQDDAPGATVATNA